MREEKIIRISCEHKNTITLGSHEISFEADEEPYKSGKYEDLTDDDEVLVESLSHYVTANYCKDCGKLFIYDAEDDGDTIQVPSKSWHLQEAGYSKIMVDIKDKDKR